MQAEKAFKRALAISKKRFGYNNMITIQCILKYGLMLLDVGKSKANPVKNVSKLIRIWLTGRVEESEKIFKDTITIMEKETEGTNIL